MNPYAACSDRVQDAIARKRVERIEAAAGRVILFHPRVGFIEAYYDRGWWVKGGNTRVRAMDKRGADRMASEWDRTGNCPAPARDRITPRRGQAV